MERDFMALDKNDESRKGEKAAMSTSGVHWPFANKVFAMQQYMTYKEMQSMASPAVHQFPSSTYPAMSTTDAFEGSQRIPTTSAQQKCINFDGKNVHQYPVKEARNYSLVSRRSVPVNYSLVSRHPVPVSTSNSKLPDRQSGPNLTASPLNPQLLRMGETIMNTDCLSDFCGTPRGMPKSAPTTAQLTIFYAGVVNVYDDVSLEKAQAIMLIASRGSNTVSCNRRSEPTLPSISSAPTKVVPAINFTPKKTLIPSSIHVTPPSASRSSSLSASSHAGTSSGNGSSSTDGTGVAKAASLLTSTSEQENMKIVTFQHEPSKVVASVLGREAAVRIMPKAVPQARKASLARFLEKRKERVINIAPYSPCRKKTLQTEFMFDSTKMSSTSLTVNIQPMKNHQDGSWSSENANRNGVNPSTKPEM